MIAISDEELAKLAWSLDDEMNDILWEMLTPLTRGVWTDYARLMNRAFQHLQTRESVTNE